MGAGVLFTKISIKGDLHCRLPLAHNPLLLVAPAFTVIPSPFLVFSTDFLDESRKLRRIGRELLGPNPEPLGIFQKFGERRLSLACRLHAIRVFGHQPRNLPLVPAGRAEHLQLHYNFAGEGGSADRAKTDLGKEGAACI